MTTTSARALAASALGIVLALVPRSAAAVCAPAASGIFPASGIAGTSVTATVPGSALSGATVTVYGSPGLAASVQGGSDIQLTLRLDVDAAAVPGERILFLETAGGSTGVSFTVNAAGGPVVASVSPPLLATLAQPLSVTITGANLAAVTPAAFTVSGAGASVTAATPSPDGTTLTLDFGIDTAADLGTHAVTLTTPAGSAVLMLYVQRPPPTLTAVHPAAGEVGATVPLTLAGANLSGAALVITGTGVRVAETATPDDATLTANLVIDPATPPSNEARLLIVTTESGQTTAEFFVVAAGVPTVTGLEPAAGEPGTTVAVTLHGLDLTGANVTVPPGDLTVQNVIVVDDETVTLDVVIAPGAATNVDHTLTLTTLAGSDAGTFRVIPTGAPFIGAVRPPFGNRGSTFTMIVKGVNLATVVPGSGVDVLDPSNKIQESNAAMIDNQTARTTIVVEPTANIGSRNVRVTTAAGTFTTANSPFRVNNPGQVPSIADVSPHIVQPGSTTPMMVTGANFAGGAALVSGPGATVSNIVVDPTGTLMTFDLALAAGAPPENRAVIVVTENGTARCGIATALDVPGFRPAQLVKPGALFTTAAAGFRLFQFDFSMSPDFPADRRTWTIADPDGTLALSVLDDVNVGRALRARHRGYVRVRALTVTNLFATSSAAAVRR